MKLGADARDTSGWWMNSSPERRVCPECAFSAYSKARRSNSLSTHVGVVRLDLGDQLLDQVFAVPSGVEDVAESVY
jgi:hypothetical protein